MKNFLLILISLTSFFVSNAQDAISLKLKPEIGVPLNYNLAIKTDIDGPAPAIINLNMKLEITPTKKEDHIFTINNLTKSIQADVDAGLITMSYDSEEGTEDELSKTLGDQFSKIINKNITLQVNELGQFINITMPDELNEEEFDQSSFSNITTVLPNHPINIGSSWNSSYEMDDNPIIGKVTSTSTLLEANDNSYTIDVIGTVANKELDEIGDVSGFYMLDKETGLNKNSKITTTIKTNGIVLTSEITMALEE